MEQGIKIKAITFDPSRDNPLPYMPSLCEWTDHVGDCVQCAHVDQLAKDDRPFNTMDLCEGGALLQMTVMRRIAQQRQISLQN
jgi:hypothetical protein